MAWVTRVNLKGPRGDAGPKGDIGLMPTPNTPVPIAFTKGVSVYVASWIKIGGEIQFDGGVNMSGLAANEFHIIANIPVGSRPAKMQYYPVAVTGSSPPPLIQLRVQKNGNVEMQLGAVFSDYIMLSAVRYVYE